MGTTLARALLRRSLRIAGSMSGALIAFGAARLGAQGTIVGRVVEGRSSLPIAGAALEVAGSRLGAITDAQGRYRITNVPAGARTLQARRIGFSQVDSAITVSASGETT